MCLFILTLYIFYAEEDQEDEDEFDNEDDVKNMSVKRIMMKLLLLTDDDVNSIT